MPVAKDEKGRWIYGDAWDRYSVEEGDIWEVGPHVFVCGDLEAGAGEALTNLVGPPAVIWTDPPWGSGNARTFRTKAAVDGPDGGRAVDWAAFQDLNASLWAQCATDVWVEMGRREEAGLTAIVASRGGRLVSTTGITYYRKSPCRLLRYRFDGQPHVDTTDAEPQFEGMDEWDLPGACVGLTAAEFKISDGVVTDYCTGQGLVPERVAQLNAASGTQFKFAGTELSARRLAVAVERVSKVTGHQPVRTGSL